MEAAILKQGKQYLAKTNSTFWIYKKKNNHNFEISECQRMQTLSVIKNI